MAAGTGNGQALKCFRRHINDIINAVRLINARINRAVLSFPKCEICRPNHRLIEPVARVTPGLLENIPGKVLQDELVIGDIFVECPDEVVTVLPRSLNREIEFVTFRFRVSDEVHPVACPAFSVCSRSEQTVHNPCIGIG